MVRIDLEVVKEWVTKIQSYFFPTLYTPTPGLTLIHFREIWDGFCNKVISDRFDQLNTFPTYFPHFWTWLLNTIAITPKSEDKYVVKVFNWSEFHLSEMTLLQNPYFSNIEISLFFEQICILMFNFIWIFLIQIAFIYILQFNYSVDIFLDMFLVMDERYHFGWIIHVCLIFISLGEITVCFF